MSETGKEDYECSPECILDMGRQQPAPRYWKTQDGRRLLPREMDTMHLHNILRMSIRNYQLKALCLAVNPEKAKANRAAWLRIANSPESMRAGCFAIRPILRDIERELLNRGIPITSKSDVKEP